MFPLPVVLVSPWYIIFLLNYSPVLPHILLADIELIREKVNDLCLAMLLCFVLELLILPQCMSKKIYYCLPPWPLLCFLLPLHLSLSLHSKQYVMPGSTGTTTTTTRSDNVLVGPLPASFLRLETRTRWELLIIKLINWLPFYLKNKVPIGYKTHRMMNPPPNWIHLPYLEMERR